MNENIEKMLVKESSPIKEVMRIIDHAALGIAFIIDEANKFVGLVTDGDIRRAILNGISLEKPVKDIMNAEPIVVYDSWSEEKLKGFLSTKKVKERFPRYGCIRIPVLDNNKKAKDILFVPEKRYAGIDIERELKEKGGVNKVLVIGGAGYLGSVLSRKLLQAGYKVRVLDNLTYGDEGIRDLHAEINFEFVNGDMRDISTVVETIKGMDAVIHLAAIVGDPASALSPQKTIEINYLATKLIADVCKYHQINRFIFASTCSVYGASLTPEARLDENSTSNPVSLYAEMKLKSEEALLEMVDSNFGPTIFRMATLYGFSPRMRFDLVVNLLTAKAIFDNKITIFGGSQWRPNLHVEDAAEAFIKCLEVPIEKVRGEIFNVGSNEQNYQIAQIGEIIHDIIPDAKIEIVEKGDERDYNVSFDKIHNKLGYKAIKSVKDGVAEIRNAIEEGKIKNYSDNKYSNYRYLYESSAPC